MVEAGAAAAGVEAGAAAAGVEAGAAAAGVEAGAAEAGVASVSFSRGRFEALLVVRRAGVRWDELFPGGRKDDVARGCCTRNSAKTSSRSGKGGNLSSSPSCSIFSLVYSPDSSQGVVCISRYSRFFLTVFKVRTKFTTWPPSRMVVILPCISLTTYVACASLFLWYSTILATPSQSSLLGSSLTTVKVRPVSLSVKNEVDASTSCCSHLVTSKSIAVNLERRLRAMR